uniref:Uncharacterized protein n=1 Tax=Peronospora matthiolae TaxID=2874970 RepID=A0AAV1UMZ5_9STRA
MGDLLRSNGLTDVIAALTPIGDDSNDEQPSDSELLVSANAPPGPMRIARYLNGNVTLKITIKLFRDDNAAPRLDAFSDADFAGDRADRKSMTGGVLLLNG